MFRAPLTIGAGVKTEEDEFGDACVMRSALTAHAATAISATDSTRVIDFRDISGFLGMDTLRPRNQA